MSSSQPDRDPRLRSASPAWWAAAADQRDRLASRTKGDDPNEPTIVGPRPSSGQPEAPAEVKEPTGAEPAVTAEGPVITAGGGAPAGGEAGGAAGPEEPG